MEAPDRETRLAILQAKAAYLGISVPEDVLALISQAFHHSVRDLEGALNRVSAFSDLTGQPITVAVAKHTLGNMMKPPQRTVPTIEVVLSQVCSFYDVSLQSLSSKRRDKHLTRARQVAIYLLREEAQATLIQIGHALGARDHTSIRYAYRQLSERLEADASLKTDVESLRSTFHNIDSP
jgi:chromosomal replication initiator protein